MTNSFLFETLDPNARESKVSRRISGSKAKKVFHSLEELDKFIARLYKDNPDKSKLENMGFAGYISYEGDLEFAFYENLEVDENPEMNLSPETNEVCSRNANFKITKPDSKTYIESLKRCQEYIGEGDIYQANLTRKFLIEGENTNIKALYENLKALNPAPYAGFMDFSKYTIISSSPESFLKIYKEKGKLKISTSPIKGTADLYSEEVLENSQKDKAEHLMILDLERNDLGKICETGSVNVDEMMRIYKFKNLYHYVSTVSGSLKESLCTEGLNLEEIFDATFPGGSITGAPKIRAMEIIKELEPNLRGPYTGTMGYLKFDEDGDLVGEFSILIRTIVLDKSNDEISFHTGGGITCDSDPDKELEEGRLKAEKLVEAINSKEDESNKEITALLETIRVEKNPNDLDLEILNLDSHLDRLIKSASKLGFQPVNKKDLNQKINNFILKEKPKIQTNKAKKEIFKLRLIYKANGEVYLEFVPYDMNLLEKEYWKVKALETKDFHIVSSDLRHGHKYFPRMDLSKFFNNHEGEKVFDELIWLNEKGQLCEGSFTNIFFAILENGELKWHTPHLDCGILPGTKRSKLIRELGAKEGFYSLDELKKAHKIVLSNAIIGEKDCEIQYDDADREISNRGNLKHESRV